MRNLTLFRISGITSKIVLLLALGLLGVIITSGGNLYLKSWTDRSIRLSNDGHVLVEGLLTSASLEDRFINSNDGELLVSIEEASKMLKQNIAHSRADTNNPDIRTLLDQIAETCDQHATQFSGIAQNVKSSRGAIAAMTDHFRRIDDASMGIQSEINKQQTMANMTGDRIPDTMMGLRDGLNVLALHTRAAMINIQSLWLLSASEDFQKKEDDISKKTKLEQMNVKSQMEIIGDEEFKKTWQSVANDFIGLEQRQKELFSLWNGNRELLPQLKQSGSKAQELANSLIKLTNDEVAANDRKSNVFNLTLILSILVCLAGSGVVVARAIIKPLNRVIGGLTENTEKVMSSSSEVARTSQGVAEGASRQAAAIEETSSSLEEMSSMTKQNAENANHANQLMLGTGQTVAQASQSMKKLITSMGEISAASEQTSKIIKTIDEIAFQTNLLALNAAVEAARAGEAGAGFAVVADEVRNLAMRSAEAAKNTSSLIEGTVKKIKEGSELVQQTEKEFQEVAIGVTKAGELVGEITAASQEQAQGIEQVNKAVTDMDKVVQQNAATAEETASASEEMNAQARQMEEFVGGLAVLVGGSSKETGKESGKESGKETGKEIGKEIGKEMGHAGRKRLLPTRRELVPAVAAAPIARKGRAHFGKDGGGAVSRTAHGASKKGAGEVRPEEVIPFEDGEFNDF